MYKMIMYTLDTEFCTGVVRFVWVHNIDLFHPTNLSEAVKYLYSHGINFQYLLNEAVKGLRAGKKKKKKKKAGKKPVEVASAEVAVAEVASVNVASVAKKKRKTKNTWKEGLVFPDRLLGLPVADPLALHGLQHAAAVGKKAVGEKAVGKKAVGKKGAAEAIELSGDESSEADQDAHQFL